MKKIIALVLVLLLMLSMAACTKTDTPPASDNTGDKPSQGTNDTDNEKDLRTVKVSCARSRCVWPVPPRSWRTPPSG